MSHKRYALILLALFLVLWLVLAISPLDRKDWALENFLAGSIKEESTGTIGETISLVAMLQYIER